MTLVYVLSEDDFDEQVYVFLLELLLSRGIRVVPMRLRRGGGIGEVRKKLPLLLSHIRRSGLTDHTYFVVGIDNDRRPEHPEHERKPHTEREACRHCGLVDTLAGELPDGWPIPGAIALPVEMIEAWLLLMHDPATYPHESHLPRCKRRDQAIAVKNYGANPPLQLADLVEQEQRASNVTNRVDFAMACVLRTSPDELAARSPSFDRFRTMVARWTTPGASPAGDGA